MIALGAGLLLWAAGLRAQEAPEGNETATPIAVTEQGRALAAKAFPDGKLIWAADTNSNAPFAFDDPAQPGRMIGFEYEIINGVAEALGVTAKLKKVSWDGLIPGLQRGGGYNCVINGIEVTPERAQSVDFSVPYYYTFEQLVTRTGQPEVTQLTQLRGKSVGTLSQTGALDMLEAAGGIDVKTYDEEINAYNDCAQGRIYAVLLDYPLAMYYAKPNPSLMFNGPPFGHLTYGIAMKKGDTATVAAINYGLTQLMTSGQMRVILSRWNLWTETMADDLRQPEEPAGPPVMYEAYLQATSQGPSLSERFARLWAWRNTLALAAFNTVTISMLSMLLAVAVGFGLAVLRVFAPKPLQFLSIVYIEVVRGTPLLIQMLFIYFGLPNIGIRLDPWTAGILALGLNYAAYEAENYRAGLLSVPKGQMEAARALGMTRRQALRHVVIPQAFRLVLPPVTNDFISLLKDSSLVTMISIMDLTNVYQRMATTYYDYFGTGLAVAVIYLLIGLPFVRLARWTEQRLAVDNRPKGQRPGLTPVVFKGQGAKPALSAPA
ncbi:MAG: ABC transporter substrate-binding protein/permease [Opitutales bacterium]|jgi:polar amino acid transport system substrate-binding protein